MGDTTKIQWTDKSWSPVIGCTKRHTGCLNCYAERYGKRFGVAWGNRGKRRRTSDGYWKQPLRWARQAAKAGKRIRVFPSLCDPLDPRIPDGVFAEWMDLIRDTARICRSCLESTCICGCVVPDDTVDGGLDWLILTKLPERWAVIPEDVRPLVWLGTSASDQPTWDEWVGRLAKAEGFARLFVSLEPLVGPVDGSKLLGYCYHCDKRGIIIRPNGTHAVCERPVVSCVIIGGESGPKARPCDVAWIRAIVKQCKDAGVAPFVKQLGRVPVEEPATSCVECGPNVAIDDDCCCTRCGLVHPELSIDDPQGGDPSEWPKDLRVREFPEVRHG